MAEKKKNPNIKPLGLYWKEGSLYDIVAFKAEEFWDIKILGPLPTSGASFVASQQGTTNSNETFQKALTIEQFSEVSSHDTWAASKGYYRHPK